MRRFSTLVAVLCVCAAPLAALPQDAQFLDGGLTFSAFSMWPERVSGGYVPVRLVAENKTGTEQRVHIESEPFGSKGAIVRRDLTLAPESVAEFELLTVCADQRWGGGRFVIELGLTEDNLRVDGYPSIESGSRPVLLITDAEALLQGEALLESAAEDLKVAELKLHRRSAAPDVALAACRPQEASLSLAAYTSLDAVVIDPRAELSDELFGVLAAWGRLGGCLLFWGAGADVAVASRPALQPWLEERFELDDERGARVYRFGLGLLGVLPSNDSLTEYRRFARRILSGDPNGAQFVRPRHESYPWPQIPGIGELPYRALIALLLVFAICIGPVNFGFVKKLGRPVLLLLTIPAMALVTSVAILAFGILHRGLDVEAASWTYSLLDQREHRSSTIERRELFAGLVPSSGLRPRAGTACLPLDDNPGRTSNGSYIVDYEEGLTLRGDFLPARRPVPQVLLSERAARARLDVQMEAGVPRVTNALEVEVEQLALRDSAGRFWVGAELPPGESVLLERADNTRLGTFDESVVAWEIQGPERGDDWRLDRHLEESFHTTSSAHLVHGSYLAVLTSNPFSDDCGIEIEPVRGRHILHGILAAEEAR